MHMQMRRLESTSRRWKPPCKLVDMPAAMLGCIMPACEQAYRFFLCDACALEFMHVGKQVKCKVKAFLYPHKHVVACIASIPGRTDLRLRVSNGLSTLHVIMPGLFFEFKLMHKPSENIQRLYLNLR